MACSPTCGLSQTLRLFPDNVSALSDARTAQVQDNEGLARAFDKAVRRKPLAFAAVAGLWDLNVGGGGTRLTWKRRVAVQEEGVTQSGRWKLRQGGCVGQDEACEGRSGSGPRDNSAWRGEAREIFEMGQRLHAAARDAVGGERSWI